MNEDRQHTLWVEKYRPQRIADCILPERLKSLFEEQIRTGELQNMLFVGGAGVGKTSCGKALCNELGLDVLFINASEQGGIDTLRTTIRSFASTISFMGGKHKCIILDEADHLSNTTQPALRGFIEEFSGNARFILTANFDNRIIEPIKSRCAVIDFSMSKDEKIDAIVSFSKRVKEILKLENVKYETSSIVEVIKTYFPDYRKILNELQRSAIGGELKVNHLSSVSDIAVKEVMTYVRERKFMEIRKWVANNVDIDFHTLQSMLYANLLKWGIESQCLPDFILILDEYDYRRAFAKNPEIQTMAMFTHIMTEIRFKE